MSDNSFPFWIKEKLSRKRKAGPLKSLLKSKKIYTVCEEAKCPNIGECFSKGTATFLILGNICTRDCGFCSIKNGIPEPPDPSEPIRIAKQVKEMGLRHAVLTSPNRDDLKDGGAKFFVETANEVKKLNPDTKVEVLIPDFEGSSNSLIKVINSEIDVLNHNVETIARLYDRVRPQANYQRSLEVLKEASRIKPFLPIKSGFMLGLGEKHEEVMGLLKDLKSVGCNMLTVGQYLRPTLKQLPVERYVRPEEFEEIEKLAYDIGFEYVASGPLVRSSYRAEEMLSSFIKSSSNII